MLVKQPVPVKVATGWRNEAWFRTISGLATIACGSSPCGTILDDGPWRTGARRHPATDTRCQTQFTAQVPRQVNGEIELQYVEQASDAGSGQATLEPGIKWIIAFKLFLSVLYLAMAVGVFSVVRLILNQNLDILAEHLVNLFKVDPDNDILNTLLDKIAGIQPQTLGLIGGGTFIYGLLELTEAVGLYLRKRWAEWLVVVATSIFIPVEIREIVHSLQAHAGVIGGLLKIGVFIINVAIVVYLIRTRELVGAARRRNPD